MTDEKPNVVAIRYSKPVKFAAYPAHVQNFILRLCRGTDSNPEKDYDIAYFGENIVIAKYRGGSYWVRDRHYMNPHVEVYYLKRPNGGLGRMESRTLFEVGKDHEVKRFVGQVRRDLLAEADIMDINEGQYLKDHAKAKEDKDAYRAMVIEKAEARLKRLVEYVLSIGWEYVPKHYNEGMKSERFSTLEEDCELSWSDGGHSPGLSGYIRFKHPNGSEAVIEAKDSDIVSKVTLPPTATFTARSVFNHAADYKAPGKPAF